MSNLLEGALDALENGQWQVDEEGIGCGVNRQALDIVLTDYKALRAENQRLRECLKHVRDCGLEPIDPAYRELARAALSGRRSDEAPNI